VWVGIDLGERLDHLEGQAVQVSGEVVSEAIDAD
jgi:hypothetical protein